LPVVVVRASGRLPGGLPTGPPAGHDRSQPSWRFDRPLVPAWADLWGDQTQAQGARLAAPRVPLLGVGLGGPPAARQAV